MNQIKKTKDNAWIGIVLIVLGSYFIIRNLHLIPYSVYHFFPYEFFSWRMVVLIIGGAMLVTGKKTGYLFLAIGALLLIPSVFVNVRWLQFNIRDLWPLILIAIGISIFVRRKEFDGAKSFSKKNILDDDYIEEVNVFGGSLRSVTSQNFKGGKVTSIFGGSEINFMDADLSSETNVIDAFCLFGGCTLVVPRNWNVIMDGVNIFGGYSDKRFSNSVDSPIDPDKTLRIQGLSIFGGGEIKRV